VALDVAAGSGGGIEPACVNHRTWDVGGLGIVRAVVLSATAHDTLPTQRLVPSVPFPAAEAHHQNRAAGLGGDEADRVASTRSRWGGEEHG
jgi:hypothetical protein